MQKTINGNNFFITVITLTGLNFSNKDLVQLNGSKAQDLAICHLQETQFRSNDTHRLKAKGWKHFSCKWYPKENKDHYANIIQNRPSIQKKKLQEIKNIF